MKTLKLVMIATFVSLVMVSFATQDPDTPQKKIIHLKFEQAIQNPGLYMAMHEQLDTDFLIINNQQTYTVDVLYMNYIVRITGTLDQWEWFFKTKIISEINPKTT